MKNLSEIEIVLLGNGSLVAKKQQPAGNTGSHSYYKDSFFKKFTKTYPIKTHSTPQQA